MMPSPSSSKSSSPIASSRMNCSMSIALPSGSPTDPSPESSGSMLRSRAPPPLPPPPPPPAPPAPAPGGAAALLLLPPPSPDLCRPTLSGAEIGLDPAEALRVLTPLKPAATALAALLRKAAKDDDRSAAGAGAGAGAGAVAALGAAEIPPAPPPPGLLLFLSAHSSCRRLRCSRIRIRSAWDTATLCTAPPPPIREPASRGGVGTFTRVFGSCSWRMPVSSTTSVLSLIGEPGFPWPTTTPGCHGSPLFAQNWMRAAMGMASLPALCARSR
mmetsp:Transcript_85418/g.187603  ORF Transcript_85418/g.187603 Transcript_85418/m.187603 type:complete len:272 (+) Transcript_85418:3116-3931(+)